VTTLEFISSLVKSLAWPVGFVVVALIFREQLRGLLSTAGLRRVRAGSLEVEWNRQISGAEVELEQPGVPSPSSGGGVISEELEPVANASPTAAVMEAHARVERALRQKLLDAGVEESDIRTGAAGLARLAAERGLISDETLRAVQGLALLRNMAAHGHGGDVTVERAKDYLALTDAILYAIDAGSGGN
jgi:hypothetical protein